MKNLIVPTVTLRTALKIRPMLLESLNRYEISPWNYLDQRLEFFFQYTGLDGGLFLRQLEDTEIPAAGSDWEHLPLHFLCDFLTEIHRNFLLQDIPDISHILDIHSIPSSSEGGWLLEIQSDFKNFVQQFILLLGSEEDFLFPKILRNEACLTDAKVHPEFHRGSLHIYLATKNSNQEFTNPAPLRSLLEKTQEHLAHDSQSFYAQNLFDSLLGFQVRLGEYRRLEQEILHVRALKTERELYNRSIRGDSRANFERDPRDSGILRLSLS